MIRIKILLLMALLPLVSYCQKEKPIQEKQVNSFYFEVFGNVGRTASLNYEKAIGKEKCWRLRFGIGYKSGYFEHLSVPVEITRLIGKKRHFFEYGFGSSIYLLKKEEFRLGTAIMVFGRIGYRYESESGFLFRVAFTPVYDHTRVFFFTNKTPFNPYGVLVLVILSELIMNFEYPRHTKAPSFV